MDANRLVKVLSLLMHDTALPGEATSAAHRLVDILKRTGLSPEETAKRLLLQPEQSDARKRNDVRMPFGKYSGRTIPWIAARHPDYLHWCLANLRKLNPKLRSIISEELEKY